MPETKTAWFYSAGNDRKGPFSEEQISALLTAGVITAHTAVWSDTAADWTPLFRTELRRLLGDQPIEPPDIRSEEPKNSVPPTQPQQAAAQPQWQTVKTYGVYDNRFLGKTLIWALWACVFASILQIGLIARAFHVDLIANAKTGQRLMENMVMMESAGFLALVSIPTIITIALWLTWKYRATANAYAVSGPQSVTPAGAVYWYFVPVMWFWKPYEAMKNLHSAFVANGKYNSVNIWWFFLLSLLGVEVVLAASLPGSITIASDVTSYIWSNLLILFLDCIQISTAIALIQEITTAETARMEQA